MSGAATFPTHIVDLFLTIGPNVVELVVIVRDLGVLSGPERGSQGVLYPARFRGRGPGETKFQKFLKFLAILLKKLEHFLI